MEWLKRLRTSKGFGVHSPFAFSLITDTLRPRPGYAYYAYSILSDPTDRLIYRLAARLDVAAISDFGSGYPLPDFVPSSRVKSQPGASESPTLYVIAPGGDITTLPDALRPGDSVLLVAPDADASRVIDEKLDAVGYGMSFHARRSFFSSADAPQPYSLFCLLSRLPRQSFNLNT